MKITADKLKTKRKEWTEHYETLKTQQKENFSFYELSYDANIPTGLGYEQKTPSTARDWVDFGIMHYTLDKPQDVVKPRNSSDSAREQATMLEAFYNYWLGRIILEIKGNAKKQLWGGECFFKIVVDDTYFGVKTSKMGEDELKEFQEKRSTVFPLRIECPNPINVFPSPAGRGFWHPEYIEYYEMTVAQAEELCDRNKWSWKHGDKKSTSTVKYTVYYSDSERCVLLDDDAIIPDDKEGITKDGIQPNWLRFTPYVHIPSGLGTESYEGKSEYKYRSIFHGKKDMIKLQTRLLSQIDAICKRYAWPRIELKGDLEIIKKLYGAQGQGFDPNPTRVQVSSPEFDILYHQGEQVPQALFTYAAAISSMAEPPPVLGGQRPPGIYSGYGEVALLTTAKPIYKDPFKNMEDGLSVLMGMGARVMENVLKYKINIGDKELDPSKIKGYYENEVHLLAEPPEAADMRKTLGANLFKQGVISDLYNKVHYQDMTMEQALKEQDQQFVEKIMNDPNLLMQMAMLAMKRLGMELSPEILQAMQGGGAGVAGTTTPTGAESVPQYQRMMSGMEASPLPQENEIRQVPIG